jgi:hypothetical protein
MYREKRKMTCEFILLPQTNVVSQIAGNSVIMPSRKASLK